MAKLPVSYLGKNCVRVSFIKKTPTGVMFKDKFIKIPKGWTHIGGD